jgi:hypothetical protein
MTLVVAARIQQTLAETDQLINGSQRLLKETAKLIEQSLTTCMEARSQLQRQQKMLFALGRSATSQ